jgi:hypothetical protein
MDNRQSSIARQADRHLECALLAMSFEDDWQ